MDIDDVETIRFNAIGGTDNITINNLTGTDVTRVIIDLAGNSGAADGLADTITVNCTALGDNLQITTTSPGIVTVTGLPWVIEIRNFDANDRLLLNTGDGNDVINALGSNIALVVDAGAGNDSLVGGNLFDTLLGGLGDDQFFRSPGGDLVLGGGGNDTIFV
jgi:Ca2+-binding RTX toxin-like protein